ncbi:Rhodopirellula transposase [Tautonia plasticadhaerens]|uniref:Rhodopirellula transposase n=1 Tax=Tautonia plasticadhaerens TaxID=2527974 RepID=A0A518H613_9BACT|nr:Rhodopirellula transposase [Tautonia plasticadhaerens]
MTQTIEAKYTTLRPLLDERARRLWAAVEARALGRGGIIRVAEATGLSRGTILAGLRELDTPAPPDEGRPPTGRLRRLGGGRKLLVDHDPDLLRDLEALVDPVTRGDPMSPLRWTCKSAAKLAEGLRTRGHAVGERTVNRLLHDLGYSLQGGRKTIEGKGHPDRDAQFRHINRRVKAFQRQGQPVVSVDAKEKELVGRYRNDGREWQAEGEPQEVKVHDFIDKDLGKAIPYGIDDLAADVGWVSVGVDHDTAEFAVESLRRWWRDMRSRAYPQAGRLLITADGGSSNGSRCRLWKSGLQRLADEIGRDISVCHFPPGTSKWDEIEHRMSCHITENWRGRPLVSREVVVNLIGCTTTKTGLEIEAELDGGSDPTGREVTDQQMEGLSIKRERFHGEWNYTIRPRQ